MGYIAHKDIYYTRIHNTSKGSHAIYKQQMENKSNTTDYNYEQCTAQSLTQFLLGRTRRQSIHTKTKKRPPFSGRRVPLPRPSACSRLVPASHAAGEPSPAPLVRTHRSTTQPALLRLPSASPPTGRSQGHERRNEKRREKRNLTTGETGASMNREEGRASRASALYSAGLRPSPHPASGSTSLREASRKGAFLTPDRLTPCIH